MDPGSERERSPLAWGIPPKGAHFRRNTIGNRPMRLSAKDAYFNVVECSVESTCENYGLVQYREGIRRMYPHT